MAQVQYQLVDHQLNNLPGLSSLPDEITIPGYAEPSEFCEPRHPDVVFPIDAVRKMAGHLVWNAKKGLLFHGPTGSGKSFLMRQFNAYLNRPVFYVTGHRTLEYEDLLGTKEIVDGDTITLDGPLVQAAQMPYATFLFEEIDRAPSNVSVSLNPILDGFDIVHTLDNGRRIKQAEGFRVMATANTAGLGDLSGDYNSANVMDTSTLRRFWGHMQWYVEPDEEFNILRKAVSQTFKDEQLRKSITFANDVRYLHTGRDVDASPEAQSAGVGNAIHTTMSTDTLIEFWRAIEIFSDVPNPIDYALRLVLTSKCTEECAMAIHRLADAQFAGDI